MSRSTGRSSSTAIPGRSGRSSISKTRPRQYAQQRCSCRSESDGSTSKSLIPFGDGADKRYGSSSGLCCVSHPASRSTRSRTRTRSVESARRVPDWGDCGRRYPRFDGVRALLRRHEAGASVGTTAGIFGRLHAVSTGALPTTAAITTIPRATTAPCIHPVTRSPPLQSTCRESSSPLS